MRHVVDVTVTVLFEAPDEDAAVEYADTLLTNVVTQVEGELLNREYTVELYD